MTTSPLRIVIADDSPLYRQTVCKILQKDNSLKVIAEAENGLAAIHVAETHKPDVVLMDITMPVMDGLKATKIISSRFPDIRVIILSMHSDDTMKASSFQAGASQYLCKDSRPKEILAAIKDSPHKR
jgi:two-component system response regulator DegU